MAKKNIEVGLGSFITTFCIGVVLVILKLFGVISWPWWVVTIPFYFWYALFFMIFILCSVAVTIGAFLELIYETFGGKAK